MATKDQLMQALRNADAMAQQGDQQAAQDARELAKRIKGISSEKPKSLAEQGKAWADKVHDYQTGITNDLIQGASMGWADEAVLPYAALAGSITTGEPWHKVYTKMHASEQQKREKFAEENPGLSLVSQVAGAGATGGLGFGKVLGSAAVRNSAPITKAAATAAVGGTEGALYGSGMAEHGDKVAGGIQGGAIGAVAAPVVGGIVNTLAKGTSRIAEGAKRRLGESPKTQAERTAREFAEAGNMTPEQIANRMDELGPEATLADVDDSLRIAAKAGMTLPGPMQQQGRKMADNRHKMQQKRLNNTISQISGKNASEYKNTISDVIRRRKEQAGPLYDEAHEIGMEMTPELEDMFSRGLVKKAHRQGKTLADTESASPTVLNQAHYTKRRVGDMIGAAIRKGEMETAKVLMGAKRRLVDEIGKQNPKYIEAMEVYASDSLLADAAQTGFNIFKKNMSPEDLRSMVAGMSNSEREMFRLGGVKALANRLDNISNKQDAFEKMTNMQDTRDRIRLLFDTDEDMATFMQQVGREEDFTQTRRIFNQQSITAQAQEAQNFLKGSSDPSVIARVAKAGPGELIDITAKLMGSPNATPEMIGELGNILLEKGMSRQKILSIFGSTKLKSMLGPRYDELVAPYIRSMSGSTVSVSRN